MKRLLLTDADAWQEYVLGCHAGGDERYEELEPWAWARLQKRLKPVQRPVERKKVAA